MMKSIHDKKKESTSGFILTNSTVITLNAKNCSAKKELKFKVQPQIKN